MSDDLDELEQGMDIQQPDWPITFASHSDLMDFVRAIRCGKAWIPATGMDHQWLRLRDNTARRLAMPVRAYLERKG